ncbi:hypothetical protein JOB18_047217 [Solea senegalensis]|uniref:Uncharacterized protein n=1 Tax=Solea senegalensis TaxID=28829 RepID=A0AAV6SCY2_SOLSE|nr:hypothetical protein JOB18_047217 [Solea senegalensis]
MLLIPELQVPPAVGEKAALILNHLHLLLHHQLFPVGLVRVGETQKETEEQVFHRFTDARETWEERKYKSPLLRTRGIDR